MGQVGGGGLSWLVKLGGMQILADEENSQIQYRKNANQETTGRSVKLRVWSKTYLAQAKRLVIQCKRQGEEG